MSWWEALILGLVQGLSEFLPVSSSGHLELAKAVLGVELDQGLLFSVVVHAATALSTVVVFRKPIAGLFGGLRGWRWNPERQYLLCIVISMLPVMLVGLLYKDAVESLFDGQVLLVGAMLLVTALLLLLARKSDGSSEIGPGSALLVGLAQAVAVLPGISRSGATIACALLLGIRRPAAARFAFLMALPPIFGAALLGLREHLAGGPGTLPLGPLALAFVAAFGAGVLACRWMVGLVQRQRLVGFAVYCGLVGCAALAWGLWST